MRDKEFEQQIREKLAGFSLGSAPEVWPAVEAALHPQKKRRWIFGLLLLALTGSALSYVVWFKHNKSDKQTIEKVALKDKKTDVESDNNLPQTGKKGDNAILNNQQKEKPENVKQHVEVYNVKDKNNEAYKTGNGNKIDRSNDIAKYLINDTNAIVKTETVLHGSVHADTLKTLLSTGENINNTSNDFIQKKSLIKEQKDSTLATNISTEKPKKSKHKWQINLFAEGGISGLNNHPFNLFSASNSGNYSSAPQNNSGGPVTSIYKLPKFERSFSFGTGVQFYKQITKRNAIAIMASYNLYQTKTSVGKRIALPVSFYELNITSNNYYTNTDSLQYMNHYHFVQSSVDYYLLLNIHHRLPLRWNIGAGAGYMFASNGLHYSINGNSFITDNSLFHNPQFFINTGFELGVGNKYPLYIGPQWRYFISPFSKENFAKRSHLNNLSLRVTVPFKKK